MGSELENRVTVLCNHGLPQKILVQTDCSSSFSLDGTPGLKILHWPGVPRMSPLPSTARGGLCRAATAAALCCKPTSSPASWWAARQAWCSPATFSGCICAPRSQIPPVTTLPHHPKVHRAAQDAQPREYISGKGVNSRAPALSTVVVRIDV